jgi:hypothetical protein
MNINSTLLKNNTNITDTTSQESNFNQLSVQQLDHRTMPTMVADRRNREITSYQITNVLEVPEFSSVITGIPTDESFIIMCQHAEQELVAQQLSNMLQKAKYTEIRKWIIKHELCSEGGIIIRTAPLEVAAKYNNFSVCKVIIEYLNPKNIIQKSILKYIGKFGTYGSYYQAWIIGYAFSSAICNNGNLDLAQYFYMLCSEDFFKYLSEFNFFDSLLTSNIENCFNTSGLDFLLKKIEQFLNTCTSRVCKGHFQSQILDSLKTWVKVKKWDMVLHILDKNLNIDYNYEPFIYIQNVLYHALEDKQFAIALNILKKLFIGKTFFEKDSRKFFTKDTILNLAAMDLDAETVVWLLYIAKLSLEKNDIYPLSALDHALLRDDYTVAHVLRVLGAKSVNANIEENIKGVQGEELRKKKQKFLSNPTRLNKLAAISLGVQYVEKGTSVLDAKKEVRTISPNLASKITKIADIFDLNLIYD